MACFVNLKRIKTIATSQPASLKADEILEISLESLDGDKAKDLISIDLEGKSNIADHMIIASGTSQRQVVAMAEHVIEKLKKQGLSGIHAEGKDQGDWVVIDAFDVIIHLFRPEVREFYNLEKMWQAPCGPSEVSGSTEQLG